MTWSDFYMVCFLVGFALSALSALLGGSHVHLPNDGHVHIHVHQGHHPGAHGLSFFNLATGAAFLAWFGGVGFLVTRYSSLWVWAGLGLAILAGAAGAAAVFWFIASVLLKHERDLDPADFQLTGIVGRLSAPVRAGGTGEMIFSQEGARRSVGARSEDGSALDKGAEVVITRYEGGIAYVKRWEDWIQ